MTDVTVFPIAAFKYDKVLGILYGNAHHLYGGPMLDHMFEIQGRTKKVRFVYRHQNANQYMFFPVGDDEDLPIVVWVSI
jgi:hypothetical protein